jgi:hypothetical protein
MEIVYEGVLYNQVAQDKVSYAGAFAFHERIIRVSLRVPKGDSHLKDFLEILYLNF